MADTLIDQLLKDMEKAATSEENKEENKEEKKEENKEAKADETKSQEKVADTENKAEEKKEDKVEKKEESAEDKEKTSAALKKLAELPEEKLTALATYIDKMAEAEKNAELAKQAEELETQGRFMYHGFAKEQIKVAYALDQLKDEDVIKIAKTLGWSVDDIMKTSDTHQILVGEQPEPSVEGMGIKGGPAENEIKGNKTIAPDPKADGQTERKQDGSGELAQMKKIINAVKNVKKDPGNLEFNG
jgi:hypothetical protein